MRSIIRSTGELSELRASVRRDLAVHGDDDLIVSGFVAALNEVVAAAVSNSEADTAAIDVRWLRRTQPHAELYAEIRNTAGTPTSLVSDGIVSGVLHRSADRVDVQERIGGSVITIRSRI